MNIFKLYSVFVCCNLCGGGGMGRGDEEKNASDAIRNAVIIVNNGNNIINDNNSNYNNNNIYRISKCRMVRKLYICVCVCVCMYQLYSFRTRFPNLYNTTSNNIENELIILVWAEREKYGQRKHKYVFRSHSCFPPSDFPDPFRLGRCTCFCWVCPDTICPPSPLIFVVRFVDSPNNGIGDLGILMLF